MARFPTGPFTVGRTGCYKCARKTTRDGSCGIKAYPCTHYGLDLHPVDDLTVYAPEDGVVTDVANGTKAPFQGYGPGIVMIRGDSGYYHLISHLGTLQTVPGARVTEGVAIGKIAPATRHTHYEVRRQRTGPAVTNTIDPAIWLRRNRVVQIAMLDVRGSQVWTTAPLVRDTFELPSDNAPRWRGPVITGLVFVGGLAAGIYWIRRPSIKLR